MVARGDLAEKASQAAPLPGRSLLRRFTLISIALTIVAATATTWAMGRIVETYLLGQVANEAHRRLDRVILPIIPSQGLTAPLAPDTVTILDEVARKDLLVPPFERLALWDRAGKIVYESSTQSPAAALPGQGTADSLATSIHDVIEGTHGRQLRIVGPLVLEGAAIGRYEIEQDFELLAAHVAEMQQFALVSVASFSTVLYLLLFRVVRGAANDLAHEAAANARLTAEQRLQSERLGVAAELARLLTAKLDLEATVQATLHEVGRLISFRHASVVLVDNDGRRRVWALGARGPLERVSAVVIKGPSRPSQVIESRAAILDLDIATTPRFIEDQQLFEEHGVRCVLSLPLMSRERVLGTLNLGHEQPGAYVAADIELLEPVVESLAAAIENAHLYAEAQRSSAIASALLGTAEALSHLGPLDQILNDVASRAVELIGADDVLIFLAEDEGARFRLRASAGVAPEKLAAFPFHVITSSEFGAFGQICTASAPLVIEDAQRSDLLPPGLAAWYDVQSCVFVPLEVGSQLQGAMVVHFTRARHRFSADEIRLATGLASQAAMAIANSRSYEAVRESEHRFRTLVQNASDLILVLAAGGSVRYVSPSVEHMLGFPPEELIDINFFTLVHPDETSRIQSAFTQLSSRGASQRTEFRMRQMDGGWRYVEAVGTDLRDDPAIGGLVMNAWDITERKSFEERLTRQAFYDPLTNLPNRALFMDRLEHALTRASRSKDTVTVMFLDLDRFKVTNDTLGHIVGDQLLVAVAQRLEAALRPGDTVARFGGDEFTVLLEGIGRAADASAAAERILAQLQPPFDLAGHETFVTASIGIACSSPAAQRPGELLRDADVALYRAKTAGRARYVVFDVSMDAYSVERLQFEADLRRAIERGELVVYYQPIVDLTDGAISGFEALVRWRHPERGLVPPGEFIPLAEENGIILGIGEWVLKEACRQASLWQAQYPADPPRVMSVNLSARQFQQPDLIAQVAGALETTGLPAAYLKLEITESAVMEDAPAARRQLLALKDLGVGLAIDDFGTGYSSLSYLQQLPVDTVKIDRSFVNGLEDDERNQAIVRAITLLAYALSLNVTAEGVENAGQLERLRTMQCNFGQGYFFARPLAPDVASALLQAGTSYNGAVLPLVG